MLRSLLTLITRVCAVSVLSWSSPKLLLSSVIFLFFFLFYLCAFKRLNISSHLINPAVDAIDNVWFPWLYFSVQMFDFYILLKLKTRVYMCFSFVSLSYLCFIKTGILWVWECSPSWQPPGLSCTWIAFLLRSLFPELIWGFLTGMWCHMHCKELGVYVSLSNPFSFTFISPEIFSRLFIPGVYNSTTVIPHDIYSGSWTVCCGCIQCFSNESSVKLWFVTNAI